jgi:hypothetical protein
MQFKSNIIITQGVALLATVLAMFGINLDPGTRVALVSVILGISAVVTWYQHTIINHPANQDSTSGIVPFRMNINVAQLVAALAMMLAVFGLNVDAATQAAIVSGIMGATAVVTWVLHIFVNHPANKAIVAAAAEKVSAGMRGKAGAFIAVMLLGTFMLGGCASSGGIFDNPQNDLQIAEAGFSTALSLYNSICDANTTITICTAQDLQEAATLEKAITDAIQAAQVVLALDATTGSVPPTQAQIDAAVQSVASAVQNYTNFVNDLQAQKSAAIAKQMQGIGGR